MKRFLIKLLLTAALFFIPAAFFHFVITPNLSGDLGNLGMIAFGDKYDGLEVDGYVREIQGNPVLVNVYHPDSLKYYPIITVGDSFSQMGECGYQYKLSANLNLPIANFVGRDTWNVVDNYISLLNNGYFLEGQTVIIENVERSFFSRFEKADLEQFSEPALIEDKTVDNSSPELEPFLNRYFSWIRLLLGKDNPVKSFHMTKDCFEHERYASVLFVYNSSGDGDLAWKRVNEGRYLQSSDTIRKLIDKSESLGVNLIIMIATDKYDAYEPWIKGDHDKNPSLSYLPPNTQIFDPTPCLRKAIGDGVKDVYKLNNTHWSVIGADIVSDSLYHWIAANDYPSLTVDRMN